MKHLKKLGIASALALVATCGVVGTASATLIEPGSTAFTLTSTNFSLSVSGGGTVACTNSTISGTTPAVGTAATWKTITNVSVVHTGCTALGFVNATVTTSGSCPVVHVMGRGSTAIAVVTMPSGCSSDVAIPPIGCTLTIAGPQTIGNGGTGAGSIHWSNVLPSVLHLIGPVIASVVSNGVGFGCATAGAHTGTLSGDYTLSSATNVTVTQ
jgi:hypothetical protein